MKTVRVVAAVIKAVNDKKEPIIFATQRGYGAVSYTHLTLPTNSRV